MDARDALDDQLLKSLLATLESPHAGREPEPHLDDEALAQFAEGTIAADDRLRVLEHLDGCVTCRRVAAMLLSEPAAMPQVTPKPRPRNLSKTIVAAVTAACLVMGLGWLLLAPTGRSRELAERAAFENARRLLLAKDFAAVQSSVEESRARGVTSGRLRNLEAQARRRMPAEVALAYAGRLTDFGYDAGGIVPRAAAGGRDAELHSAYDLLAHVDDADEETRLNRGHALLSLGRPREAVDEFQRVVEGEPELPLARLGMGLAEFMLGDYSAAEQNFRRCLASDPANDAARFDLAMTLEEQDRFEEALGVWNELKERNLSSTDRLRVERAIDSLKAQLER